MSKYVVKALDEDPFEASGLKLTVWGARVSEFADICGFRLQNSLLPEACGFDIQLFGTDFKLHALRLLQFLFGRLLPLSC